MLNSEIFDSIMDFFIKNKTDEILRASGRKTCILKLSITQKKIYFTIEYNKRIIQLYIEKQPDKAEYWTVDMYVIYMIRVETNHYLCPDLVIDNSNINKTKHLRKKLIQIHNLLYEKRGGG